MAGHWHHKQLHFTCRWASSATFATTSCPLSISPPIRLSAVSLPLQLWRMWPLFRARSLIETRGMTARCSWWLPPELVRFISWLNIFETLSLRSLGDVWPFSWDTWRKRPSIESLTCGKTARFDIYINLILYSHFSFTCSWLSWNIILNYGGGNNRLIMSSLTCSVFLLAGVPESLAACHSMRAVFLLMELLQKTLHLRKSTIYANMWCY